MCHVQCIFRKYLLRSYSNNSFCIYNANTRSHQRIQSLCTLNSEQVRHPCSRLRSKAKTASVHQQARNQERVFSYGFCHRKRHQHNYCQVGQTRTTLVTFLAPMSNLRLILAVAKRKTLFDDRPVEISVCPLLYPRGDDILKHYE